MTEASALRLPPTGCPSFRLVAEPALTLRLADFRLNVVFLAGHMVDACALAGDVAFYLALTACSVGSFGSTPLPRWNRIGQAPETEPLFSRSGLRLQEFSILYTPIGPGVAFTHEFVVDVSLAEHDGAEQSAVLVSARDFYGHFSSEDLF